MGGAKRRPSLKLLKFDQFVFFCGLQSIDLFAWLQLMKYILPNKRAYTLVLIFNPAELLK